MMTFRVLGFRVSDGAQVPLVIRVPAPAAEHVPADVVIRVQQRVPD